MIIRLIGAVAKQVARFRKEDSGATAIEYGLIVALIAAVIVGVVGSIGTQVKSGFTTVCSSLNTSFKTSLPCQ